MLMGRRVPMRLSSELFRRGDDALANQAVALEAALEEAVNWLDADLALTDPEDRTVAMADGELIDRWRSVAAGPEVSDGE